jgi:hypothetical protein
VKYGLGQSSTTLSSSDIQQFLISFYASFPLYNLALLLCKISLVLQYRRIFSSPDARKLCLVLLVFLGIYGIWTVFGSLFMCAPVSFFWGATDTGNCMDKSAFWFANAAINIVTDVVIFAIPVALINKLNLPRGQKIALMILFACGSV